MNIKNKLLQEIRREAKQYNVPILHEQKAAWLLELIKQINPTKVLELGTATGYSGIILGSQDAHLTTIELSAVELTRARKNFKKAGTNVTIIYGDAVEQVAKLEGTFDLIFIDFMNRFYLDVFEDCLRLSTKGGVIIADNINHDGCHEFKEMICNDKRLDTKIVDIGDGISTSRIL